MKGSSSTAAIHSSIAADSGSGVLAAVVVSAGVPGAPPLLVVHAERDIAVLGDGREREGAGVREAASGLGSLARAALELPADL